MNLLWKPSDARLDPSGHPGEPGYICSRCLDQIYETEASVEVTPRDGVWGCYRFHEGCTKLVRKHPQKM
jgi:hypothetical protein